MQTVGLPGAGAAAPVLFQPAQPVAAPFGLVTTTYENGRQHTHDMMQFPVLPSAGAATTRVRAHSCNGHNNSAGASAPVPSQLRIGLRADLMSVDVSWGWVFCCGGEGCG